MKRDRSIKPRRWRRPPLQPSRYLVGSNGTRTATIRRLADIHGWRCWYCGIDVGFISSHIDHIEPKSVGGDDGFFNFALACPACNRAKFNKSVVEFVKWLDWIRAGNGGTVMSIRRLVERSS